jgi:hypothetical protein
MNCFEQYLALSEQADAIADKVKDPTLRTYWRWNAADLQTA